MLQEGKWNEFIRRVLPRFILSRTTLRVLRSFEGREPRLGDLLEALRDNPRLEAELLRSTSQSLKHGEIPSLRLAILLQGLTQTRDQIVKIQAQLRDGPRRALQAEQVLWELRPAGVSTHSITYAHHAYEAGLAFDILESLAVDRGTELDPRYWDRALGSAQLALESSRAVVKKSPTSAGAVFGAAILHSLGEAVLALLWSEYTEFDEVCQKASLPMPVREFAELRRFGISAFEVSRVLCRFYAPLKPLV